MAYVVVFPKGARASLHPDAADVTFVSWLVTALIGLAVASIWLGIGMDPEILIYASP